MTARGATDGGDAGGPTREEELQAQGDLLAGVGQDLPDDEEFDVDPDELSEAPPGSGDEGLSEGGEQTGEPSDDREAPVPSDRTDDPFEGEGPEEPEGEGEPAAETVPEGPAAAGSRPESRRKGVFFELVSAEGGDAAAPPPAGEKLSRAKELVRAGRVEEALAVYREILDENPGSLKARNNLGVLYDELGHHELALEQFEAAEKLGPDNVEVLTNLGSTLGIVARYEEADAALRRALRLEPESVAVRAAVGILHYRRGVYGLAESELRWVCEQDPDHAEAFYYRGEALNRLGRFDEALDALERAVVLQPGNPRAFYTLGHLYDRKHLPEEAALMYRKARELQRK